MDNSFSLVVSIANYVFHLGTKIHIDMSMGMFLLKG
jgi:hypothetical protein